VNEKSFIILIKLAKNVVVVVGQVKNCDRIKWGNCQLPAAIKSGVKRAMGPKGKWAEKQHVADSCSLCVKKFCALWQLLLRLLLLLLLLLLLFSSRHFHVNY